MFVCCDTNDTRLCTLGSTVEAAFNNLIDFIDSDLKLEDVVFFAADDTQLKFTYVLTPVLAPTPEL